MVHHYLAAVLTKATIVLMLMVAMPACSDPPSAPDDPIELQQQPPPPPPAVELAMFTDSDFSTSDVRDVHGQIVQFNRANNSLIWAADGRNFPGYPVDGNFLGASRSFQVRFGTEGGQPRAYFTETVPATICDIEVVGSALLISPTNVTVPRN
jgi:hypothetical protein